MYPSACGLCGSPARSDTLERICGLDVCDQCSKGDLAVRFQPRGFGPRVELERGVGDFPYVVRAFVTWTREVPIRATFRPEGALVSIGDLFSREIRVGDPLFDEAVHVTTETEGLTRSFLSVPGVQDAIMELVGTTGAARLGKDGVSAVTRSREPSSGQREMLACCALLHYVEQFVGTPAGPVGPYR